MDRVIVNLTNLYIRVNDESWKTMCSLTLGKQCVNLLQDRKNSWYTLHARLTLLHHLDHLYVIKHSFEFISFFSLYVAISYSSCNLLKYESTQCVIAGARKRSTNVSCIAQRSYEWYCRFFKGKIATES